jgi:hypothetical protein
MRPCLDCRTPTDGSRCPGCRSKKNATRDRQRGSRQQRGYGADHDAERARLQPVVDAGLAECTEPVCLEADRWIAPGSDWDLAHNREEPGTYRGPAHARCNRAEGGRWSAAADRRP